jgi:predicted porin
MTRNRVWIAVVAGFVLSSANLVYAQNVTPSTSNSDALVDVLKTLETKGVLTPQEFEALKAKVTKDEQKAAVEQQTAVQQEVKQTVQQAVPQLQTVAMQTAEGGTPDNNVTMMSSGIGFHTGRWDFSVSGEVNGFYVHDRADTNLGATEGTNAAFSGCGLCVASIGALPSSSIRSGLLPGDISFKISTQEKGWDVAVFFGIWPGIQNSQIVTINNNLQGGVYALGTPGIDFRQQFATLGRAHVGTLKIGRDLGFFGQEAILNDMTLLGAGSPNGNVGPGSVTLGRIGVGYVYTDFMPQISYTSPSAHGLQGAFGIFQALDDPFSPSTLAAHGQPMFQGKVTYTAPFKGSAKLKVWSNFITQSEEANLGSTVFNNGLNQGDSIRMWGLDYGAKLGWHGLGLVAYGYNGSGLGALGLLYGGVGVTPGFTAPTTRPSSGYYFQPSYTYHKAFFGYSYGQSILTAANSTDLTENTPPLRANSSHIAQFRYAVTSWDNLVAEWSHTRSEAQGGATGTSDAIALGTIVFF